MTNIFDDPEGRFLALVNDEGQYSLWPAVLEIPAGWQQTHPKSDRDSVLRYIEQQWTDMRPRSLVREMSDGL